MRILLAFCLILWTLSTQGAISLIKREMFLGGTYTSGSPGSFDSVAGTLFKRASGPSTNAQAYSADVQSAQASTYGLFNNSAAHTYIGCWIFVKASTAAGVQPLYQGPFGSWNWQARTDGLYYGDANNTMTKLAGVANAGYGQWIWIAIASYHTGTTLFNVRYYYKLQGQDMTNVASFTGVNCGASTATPVQFGAKAAAANQFLNGRVGGCSLYSFTNSDFSEIIYPADLVEPVSPQTWYVNPSSGSDANDGNSPSSAWQTAGKLNTESANCGLFSAASFALGDTLVIDTSSGVLDLSTTNLTLATRGLSVKATNSVYWTNLLCQTLTNSSFTAHGLPNLYQITTVNGAGFGQSNIVVWEDDKWLSHATGATLASVTNALTTNAGSFWTDGSTIYLHPFANSNPLSDGKSYTRSVARSVTGSGSAINITSSDVNFTDCYARKTCMAQSTDNDSLGAYLLGSNANGALSGTSQVAHCYFDYGSKHCLGDVSDATNSWLVISNVTCEQGSPYFSQTPFVSFMASANDSGNTRVYINCTNLHFQGLIGSTSGDSLISDSLYSHNTAGSNQYATLYVTGCNFSGGSIATAGTVVFLTISNSTFQGSGGLLSISNNVVRCKTLGFKTVANGGTNGTLTMRNNILLYTNKVDNSLATVHTLIGTNDWADCTMDFAPSQSGNLPAGAIYQRTGFTKLLAFNNIFKMGAGLGQSFFSLTNTDLLTLSNNVYLVGTNSRIGDLSNTNCTLALWNAFGLDANSIGADPRLDAQYNLLGDSPARNSGASLGIASDYTGATFANRNDAGAIEYRRKRAFGW